MEMVNIASCSNQELMTAIRKYEGIYNKSCLDYKSQFYKRKAWLAIANELHSDVTTVHTRYNNIRTSFSRYLKSIRYFRGGLDSSSSGIAIKPKYEFLRWLIVHIKHRKSKAVTYDDAIMQGPSAAAYWEEEEEDEIDQVIDDEEDVHQLNIPSTSQDFPKVEPAFEPETINIDDSPQHQRQHPPPTRSWSQPVERDTSIGSTVMNTIQHVNDTYTMYEGGRKPDNLDEDMLFCLSLVPKMRRVPGRLKTSAQLRILQVVSELEMAEAGSM
ncbi:uncharacterized protein [Asterias amurensis]|uniref:uncharacterized protein n=1 Tax=Asterias amurensis TaxID=7602 RepID=UPI003AB6EDC4